MRALAGVALGLGIVACKPVQSAEPHSVATNGAAKSDGPFRDGGDVVGDGDIRTEVVDVVEAGGTEPTAVQKPDAGRRQPSWRDQSAGGAHPTDPERRARGGRRRGSCPRRARAGPDYWGTPHGSPQPSPAA